MTSLTEWKIFLFKTVTCYQLMQRSRRKSSKFSEKLKCDMYYKLFSPLADCIEQTIFIFNDELYKSLLLHSSTFIILIILMKKYLIFLNFKYWPRYVDDILLNQHNFLYFRYHQLHWFSHLVHAETERNIKLSFLHVLVRGSNLKHPSLGIFAMSIPSYALSNYFTKQVLIALYSYVYYAIWNLQL